MTEVRSREALRHGDEASCGAALAETEATGEGIAGADADAAGAELGLDEGSDVTARTT
jgi:hypothetical protein